MGEARWPLVRITWVDSVAPHGWVALDKATSPHDLTCESVGWLIEDGEDRVTICAHVQATAAATPFVDGVMTIPRRGIVQLIVIAGLVDAPEPPRSNPLGLGSPGSAWMAA